MTVTVREARRADAERIVGIAERTWHAAYGELLDEATIEAAMAEWYDPTETAAAIANDAVAYFVAVDGDGLAGYVSGVGEGSVGHLGAIYVEPERWGAGIGTTLLDRFERFCTRRGYDRITFEVLAENERAKAFYRARGFEPIETQNVELFGESVRETVFSGSIG